jgi:NACalpha-BTF3-like transcription factor
MKLTEMFPSNLLKAQDVTDAGGEMPLTIESVELKEFDGDNGKERKPIIHFKEGKQMVCNKTNGNAIAELYGDDTDGWIGKELILVVRDVDFQGKSTPAIRVKNLSSKDVQIQAFWSKVRELNYSRDEGLAALKEHGGDFVKATAALTF